MVVSGSRMRAEITWIEEGINLPEQMIPGYVISQAKFEKVCFGPVAADPLSEQIPVSNH